MSHKPQAFEFIVSQIAAKAGAEPIHVAAVLLRVLSSSLANHVFIGEAEARCVPTPTLADEIARTSSSPRTVAEWFDHQLDVDAMLNRSHAVGLGDDKRFDDHAREWHAAIGRAIEAVREWMREQREAFETYGRDYLANDAA